MQQKIVYSNHIAILLNKILFKYLISIFFLVQTGNNFAFILENNPTKTDSLDTIKSQHINSKNQYIAKKLDLESKHLKNQKLFFLFASLFVLASFIFYFYYQNLILKQKNNLKDIDSQLQYKIISATLDGRDYERNKISEMLHDNVSALLSSISLHLSALENNLDISKKTELKKVKSLVYDAHEKVRNLSHELVPPLLVKFGLNLALKDLCEKNSNTILNFTFLSNLKNETRYNYELESKIYYIVSELFNNIIKHSKASQAKLLLDSQNENLIIVIDDNGIGFNEQNTSLSNGFGITQIKARLKSMNGSLKIKSEKNFGSTITIKIAV